MRNLACLAALFCGIALAQTALPEIQGQTLSGKAVTLPAAAGGKPALLILGFTHGSQTQTKAWEARAAGLGPVWSIAVLEDVPRLVRGMALHGIKSSIPKERYDRFVVVYRGEKELKQAVGFGPPDDAYLLAIDAGGAIRWRYHGPVTDAAVEEIRKQLAP
ncbi:MAG TPA: hypothetical protein VKX45_23745 [Bryobacteraceae bacterium]|jgi:hypothetical protein|nr:hypothetical protein [Bryobacteraceae bacterium]